MENPCNIRTRNISKPQTSIYNDNTFHRTVPALQHPNIYISDVVVITLHLGPPTQHCPQTLFTTRILRWFNVSVFSVCSQCWSQSLVVHFEDASLQAEDCWFLLRVFSAISLPFFFRSVSVKIKYVSRRNDKCCMKFDWSLAPLCCPNPRPV